MNETAKLQKTHRFSMFDQTKSKQNGPVITGPLLFKSDLVRESHVMYVHPYPH
jgi:hypothetical protein